jgi:hypothetical protein
VSFWTDIPNHVHAAWKYGLSFLKRDWQLQDYPIRVMKQEPTELDPDSRYQLRGPYIAQIINWWVMDGAGATKAEALADLERVFRERTAQKLKPRPGTRVPVEYVAQDRVTAHPELLHDFTRRVLELDWVWVSDQSSLWDFHDRKNNDEYIERIRRVYGIDVSDIESANLADILDRIASLPQDGGADL